VGELDRPRRRWWPRFFRVETCRAPCTLKRVGPPQLGGPVIINHAGERPYMIYSANTDSRAADDERARLSFLTPFIQRATGPPGSTPAGLDRGGQRRDRRCSEEDRDGRRRCISRDSRGGQSR
jgi:hypothetical protein